jgi:hypothetical protein
VRNVLHELNISDTALLFNSLHQHLDPACEVYIQDYVRLPHSETGGHAGWNPLLLENMLSKLGFTPIHPVTAVSKSGTAWFSLIVKPCAGEIDPSQFEQCVADARAKQLEIVTDELDNLSATSVESISFEYLVRQIEVANLSVTLKHWGYESHDRTSHSPHQKGILDERVPLSAVPMTALDFADEFVGPATHASGLRAVLSSKHLIDLPSLLAACRERAYFAGYSQRSLLLNDQNRFALRARAMSMAYSSKKDLRDNIRQTLIAFNDFARHIGEPSSTSSATNNCELRFTQTIPPCSYFILDDLCFVSLYSARLTGGMGPCLIFEAGLDTPNMYFSVLLQEFRLAWKDGTLP